MKKTLIAALILLITTTNSCLANAFDTGNFGLDFSTTGILASSVFWHLIDQLRNRELASIVVPASSAISLPAPQADAGLLAAVSLDLALRSALPDRPTPAPQNFCNHVSISLCAVRRIVERECRAIREEQAGRDTSHPDLDKEKRS